MDLLELIGSRCSMRTFQDKAVEDEKIAMIFEAGRWAPTIRAATQDGRLATNTSQCSSNMPAPNAPIQDLEMPRMRNSIMRLRMIARL